MPKHYPVRLTADENAYPVQVLRPAVVGAGFASSTVASASAALPSGGTSGSIVRVASTTDCYITFGTSGVTADNQDILFTPGVEYFVVPDGATHIAALAISSAGVVQVTVMG